MTQYKALIFSIATFLLLCISLNAYAVVIYLQAGMFKQQAHAQTQLHKVATKTSNPARIIRDKTALETYYYVIVTGFSSRQQANKEQVSLAKAGIKTLLKAKSSKLLKALKFTPKPFDEAVKINNARQRIEQAINDPEIMLNEWVNLPVAPKPRSKKAFYLSINEAILLALRYNPNLQTSELNRITQRYALYKAHNDLELQYALGGNANIQRTRVDGISAPVSESFAITPEVDLKTTWGTQLKLDMQNNYDNQLSYTPTLQFNVTQPLLRGAGATVNTQGLMDAIDSEIANKLQLRQSIIDQVTQVINAYRNIIQSKQQLISTQRQLKDAQKTVRENKLKIKAGELAPTGNIQSEYQVESLRIQVVQGKNSLVNAEQSLIQAIGLDPDIKLTVSDDTANMKVTVPDLNDTIDYALSHNTAYLLKKIDIKKSERAYKVALNQQLWQLDLTADISSASSNPNLPLANQGSSLLSGKNLNGSLNLQLSVPINDVNLKSQLITAKVNLENAKIELLRLKRELINGIKSDISAIEAAANSYRLAIKQQQLARQSYQLEKKKKDAGISTSLNVSNTQNQLLNAQIGLINAKISYFRLMATLDQKLGTTLERWKLNIRYG